MKVYSLVVFFSLVFILESYATEVTGIVMDDNREPLIGATINIPGTSYSAVAGLDGSYAIRNVEPGNYSIEIRYIGYEPTIKDIEVTGEPLRLDIILQTDFATLGEVVVAGDAIRGSEAQARMLERNALNTLNVVSARSIELSPDITVAQVIQRVSGLSVERNSSGDAQHAIIRGMNKRYNYTLVNGVKIPSPDDKNRYVPLDIFPAQMLERLEVSKSLTADMEGDAIGGGMNMVMKRAPEEFEFNADFQLGFSQINWERGFWEYDRSVVNKKSPEQKYGGDYQASIEDFSTGNIVSKNIIANFTQLHRLNMRNTGVTDLKVLADIMSQGALQNENAPGNTAILDIRQIEAEDFCVIYPYIDNIADLDGGDFSDCN